MRTPFLVLSAVLLGSFYATAQTSCGNPDEDAFFLPNSRVFCVDTNGIASVGFNLVNNGSPGDYQVTFPNGEDTTYLGVSESIRIERDFSFECGAPPGSPLPPTEEQPFYRYEGKLRIERVDCVDEQGDPPRQTYDFGVIPNPILNIEARGESCVDPPFVINASPVLCNPFLVDTYQWFVNGQPVAGATGMTLNGVQVDSLGQILLGLRVTNSRGCDTFFYERPVVLDGPPSLSVEYQVDSSLLCAPVLTIPVRTTAANVTTFRWTSTSDDVVFSDAAAAEPLITINNSEPAERLIIVIASNETCPPVSDTLRLNTGAGQAIAVEDSLTTCTDVPYDLCERIVYTPEDPGNISWSSPDPGVVIEDAGTACPRFTFSNPGTTRLVASGRDACGQPFREEVLIEVRDGRPLTFRPAGGDTICATGGPINLLDVISPAQNVASIDGGGVTDFIFDPAEFSGTVPITVVDYCGSTYEFAFTVVRPLRFNQPVPKLCLGDAIDLRGVQEGRFSGAGVDAGGVFRSDLVGVGTHLVEYSNTPYCGTTDTVVIVVEERPVSSFTLTPEGCTSDTLIENFATGQDITLQNTSVAPVVCYEVVETGSQYCEREFAVVSFDSAGQYTLRQIVSFPGGACRDTSERVITVVAPVEQTFAITIDSSSCDSFDISLLALSPDPEVDYLWSFSSGTVSEEASPELRLAKAVNPEVFSAQVTATNGCFTFRDTFDIIVPQALRVDFGIINDNRTICSGDTARLIDNTAGFDRLTVRLPDGSESSALPNRLVLTNTSDTILTYPIVVEGSRRNCPPAVYADTIFVLPVQTEAAFNLAYDQSCSPQSVTLTNLSSPGSKSLVFWGDGSTPEILEFRDTTVHVYRTTVDTVFTVTMESTLCGTDVFTTTLPVLANPRAAFEVTGGGSSCVGDSITFMPTVAVGDNSLSWDFGDGSVSVQPAPAHVYSDPGLYTATLSVITRAGCVDRDTVRIRVEEFTGSRLGVTVPGTSCVDTPLDLTVSAPGLTVSYDYGNSVISEEPVSVPYRTEGIYLLTVTGRDQNGCRTDTSTLIEIFPPLDVHIIPDSATVEVELGDQLELGFMTVPDRPLAGIDWEGMDSLVTLMSQFTPLVLPTQDVLYRLSVTDDYGCRATDSLLVRVATNYDDRIFVPNIFSPNGDARNDRFGVQAKPNTVAEIPYLRVLSRWGGLVYECQNCPLDDPMQGWDGTIDGKVAPMGVYVWIAEIVFSDGGIRQFRGDVMLLR